MRNKRWVPYLLILLFSGVMIWILTQKPPPKIPQFPTIKGKIHGIDNITLFVFLPIPDQWQVTLFVDFQKAEYGKLSGGFVIHFFNDFHNTPSKYPFSESQMKHLCAVYRYNHKAGLDQLSWKTPPKGSAADHFRR